MIKQAILITGLITAAMIGLLSAKHTDEVPTVSPTVVLAAPQIADKSPIIDYTFEFPLVHGAPSTVAGKPASATGDGSAGQ